MSAKQRSKNLNQETKKFVLVYGLIVAVLGFTLLFLLLFQIINWAWINGFTIGAIVSGIGLILINKSLTILLTSENHYLYVLLLIIRLGLYLVPFLLAFFILDGAVFYYGGVLIGFVPLVLFPWVTSSAKFFGKKPSLLLI